MLDGYQQRSLKKPSQRKDDVKLKSSGRGGNLIPPHAENVCGEVDPMMDDFESIKTLQSGILLVCLMASCQSLSFEFDSILCADS